MTRPGIFDAFFLQNDNQVPPPELEQFWEKLATHFDKHLQLSESVEGALLAVPGREAYDLPKEERHALMNVNYLENIHRIAGAEKALFKPFFHPTRSETRKATRYRKTLGEKSFIVMWSLSGSSVHKSWPYTDNVIANMLTEHKNVKVILVGDGLCQMLESGWEKEKRVIRKSGRWNIRKVLSLIPHVDLVIGTETGVLNCAGMIDVPKIIMLSHSTKENLTKHWVNTIALEPEDTPCYPCHQMHYGFKYCSRDETTGTASCAANIGYDRVIEAVNWAIKWGNLNEYIPGIMWGLGESRRICSPNLSS